MASEESSQTEKRKIWLIGKSKKTGEDESSNRHGTFVLSLPYEWTKKMGGEGTIVRLRETQNGLLIIPPIESAEKPIKTFEIEINEKNIKLLKYRIISAYMNNYQGITLINANPTNENEQVIKDILDELKVKLLGFSYQKINTNSTRISMVTKIERILDIMKDMYTQAQAIHDINQESFNDFSVALTKRASLESFEDEIDKNSYLIKRELSIAIEDKAESAKIGINYDKIIFWDVLNTNLERIGDLQHEINVVLRRFIDEKRTELDLKTDNFSFKEYHDLTMKMVNDLNFTNKKIDLEIISKILESKKDPEHNKCKALVEMGYIKNEQSDSIIKRINDEGYLRCLDQRMCGLAGCATNLAEAWLNLFGPEENKLDKATNIEKTTSA